MSALIAMISAHPFTSIWLALTLGAWFFIYSASRAQEGPEAGPRG
jgi:hypothetical protein